MKGGWVYIMADRYRGTIYVGVTSDLAARVHAEPAPTIEEAIARENAIKKWNRAWKIDLIEKTNPDWRDLFETIDA